MIYRERQIYNQPTILQCKYPDETVYCIFWAPKKLQIFCLGKWTKKVSTLEGTEAQISR
jgi:hypothetical protein